MENKTKRINQRAKYALSKLNAWDLYWMNYNQQQRLWDMRMVNPLPLTDENVQAFVQATEENGDLRDYLAKDAL